MYRSSPFFFTPPFLQNQRYAQATALSFGAVSARRTGKATTKVDIQLRRYNQLSSKEMQRVFFDQKSYAIQRHQNYQEYKICATHQLPGAMETSIIHESHQHSMNAKNAEVSGHAMQRKQESHIVDAACIATRKPQVLGLAAKHTNMQSEKTIQRK